MKNFLQIIRYVGDFKAAAALNILFNILSVSFNLLSLLLFIPFLDLLFGNSTHVTELPSFAFDKQYFEAWFNYTMYGFIASTDAMRVLTFICIVIAVLFFLKNVFRYLAMYMLAGIRNGVSRNIRNKIYQRIIHLPLSFFQGEKKGDMITRLSSDVVEIENSIMGSLEMIFRDPISVVISVVSLLILSPQLTLFSLILLPISALIIGSLAKSLKRTSRKGQNKLGDLVSNFEETLSGIRILKAFRAEKQSTERFEKLNASYNRINNRLYRKRDLASPLSEFLGAMVMIALVWFGGKMILGSDDQSVLNGSEFIVFIVIFSQALRPIQAISSAWANIMKGVASVDRINEILDAQNPIILNSGNEGITELSIGLEFKNVSFAYEEDKVLKNINFKLEKGKVIALVGASGAGKSTIADLIPRFYDYSEGEILIDGKDIRKYKLSDLRGLMGIVTQQSILFNDTVYNNIALGDSEASEEQIKRAAKVAHAEEFIVNLPDGYNTIIGDSGDKLSGGQKQRLTIARAVLKDPNLLILDEATSALDTESEKLVQDALLKLMKNRTSLVIAHRLSTIQHADEILVMQNGGIVERGNHNDLTKMGGIYARMQEMQSFD